MSLFNLEAEQALLGAVLFDSRLLERLAALRPEHFYDPVHGRMLEQARATVSAGRVADGVSLKPWACTDPGMIQLGGAAYLMKVFECAAPLTSQALSYAEVIRDLAARRAAALVIKAALERIERDDDLLDTLAESEAGLRAITDQRDTDSANVIDAGDSFILGMDTRALAMGLPSLDERLGGLHRGELVILAGRPSMGKTALADQIARNVAERGRAVHFASLEMPKEQLACRAMSAFSWRREYGTERVEYYHLRNGSNVSRDLLRSLRDELPASLMIDDRAGQTLAQLEHGARATRRKLKRLDLIVVDYLQLMRAVRSDGRVNEITEISQGLKVIAKRLDCPVLALSQLSRAVEGRDNKRPLLSDLRESGSIEQDADAVIAVYREAYYLKHNEPAAPAEWAKWEAAYEQVKRELEVITLKQRGGPTGTDKLDAWLEFDVVRDRRAA